MSPQRMLIITRVRPMDLFRSEEDPRLVRLKRRDPAYLDVLRSEQELLEMTLGAVQAIAESRGWSIEVCPLGAKFDPVQFDLIVPIGGDGTVLEVSHFVRDQPVLGVNSSPQRSVGFYCGADARSFAAALDAWMKGRASEWRVTRMEVLLGGAPLPYPALNDALFSHANPAAMSRYRIAVGDAQETQMSSGIWISTGAGSTAAIYSAGGQAMPLESPDLQYKVREPYYKPNQRYTLLGGLLDGGAGFTVVSRMETGSLFLDGHYRRVDFSFGDEIIFRRSGWPLRLVAAQPVEPAVADGAALEK